MSREDLPSIKRLGGFLTFKRIALLLILLPFVLYLIWRGSVSLDISRLQQRSVDRGEPQSLAELGERSGEIKDEDNAAIAILAMRKQREAEFTGDLKSNPINPLIPYLGTTANKALPWPPAELQAAREFAASRKEWNAAMREALARPEWRLPGGLEDFEWQTDLLGFFKRELVSLQVENNLAIQEGRIADSIELLEQMARVTNTLKEEPFLISQLVYIACAGITMRNVGQLISWHALDHAELKQLQGIVQDLRNGDGLYQALLGERLLLLRVFDMPVEELNRSAGGASGMSGVVWRLMKLSGYLSADRRLMLDSFDRILVLSTNATPANLIAIENVISESSKAALAFPPKIFSGMQLPTLGKMSQKFLRFDTERKLLLLALGIESYRLDHDGRLPESLEELAETESEWMVTDPFDGRPLRYRRDDDGYLIYSVGPDLVDNAGGKATKEEDYAIQIDYRHEPTNALSHPSE